MEQIKTKDFSKYVFIVFFLSVLVLSFFIVRPFMIAIVSGILLTYIFNPFYNALNKKIKNKTIAAILMSLFVVIIILLFLAIIATALVTQAIQTYNYFNSVGLNQLGPLINHLTNSNMVGLIKNIIGLGLSTLTQIISSFVISLPKKILAFFIMVFVMYYCFKEWDSFKKELYNIIPIKESHKKKLVKYFGDVTHATIYGQVITALIQGAIGIIGFYIFGVSSPLLWGFVIVLFAMIPFLGPWLVWFPASLIMLLNKQWFNGIGLFIYGFFLISTIDNLIKPRLIGKRARMHPIIALIGVVGGLYLFGVIGIIIGPLILTILLFFLRTYEVEKNEI